MVRIDFIRDERENRTNWSLSRALFPTDFVGDQMLHLGFPDPRARTDGAWDCLLHVDLTIANLQIRSGSGPPTGSEWDLRSSAPRDDVTIAFDRGLDCTNVTIHRGSKISDCAPTIWTIITIHNRQRKLDYPLKPFTFIQISWS